MAVKQLSIIIAVIFLSYGLSEIFHLPIPYNVIGFILLFLALVSGVIKEQHIDTTSDFIIRYMALFFVVPIVGIMEHAELFKSQFVQIFLPLVISILLGVFAAAKVTELIIERGRKTN